LADGENAVAIGFGSTTASNGRAVAIGSQVSLAASNSIGIGRNIISSGDGGISLGEGANVIAASGIAIGRLTNVDAARGIAIGDSADADGANCIAIGGNVTDDDSADCSAADSVAIGQHILADDIGEFAFASGEFAVQSDAHRSWYVLRNQTTDGTETELFADASSGDISIGSDCTAVVEGTVVARQSNADDQEAGYKFVTVIGNNAGTTALVGVASITTLAEDVTAWGIAVTADNTNDGINIKVTGAASDSINWVAAVNVTYTCG